LLPAQNSYRRCPAVDAIEKSPSRGAPEKVRDTYRDAGDAALERCTPLRFSTGMGGAVAGRPIAIRFVDEGSLA
jgi:hypothetical protein